jgi:hypothetical protein
VQKAQRSQNCERFEKMIVKLCPHSHLIDAGAEGPGGHLGARAGAADARLVPVALLGELLRADNFGRGARLVHEPPLGSEKRADKIDTD